jgi:hypothetical protein
VGGRSAIGEEVGRTRGLGSWESVREAKKIGFCFGRSQGSQRRNTNISLLIISDGLKILKIQTILVRELISIELCKP